MPTVPLVPNPPPPTVPRVDPKTGQPTTAWVEYEQKLVAWQRAVYLKVVNL